MLILLDLPIRPGKLEEVRAHFAEVLPDTRAFDGCGSVSLVVNRDDPTQAMLVERWESQDKYDAYVAWRASLGDERLGAMLAGPPSNRSFDDLDA